MEVNPQNLSNLFMMLQTNNQQQVMSATQDILSMEKYVNDFINASFEIASNPQFETPIEIRISAASQFMRAIDKNIDSIEPTFYKLMLTTLVPQIAKVCDLNEFALVSPLIESFRLLIENFMMNPSRFDTQPVPLFQIIFQSIFSQFDTNNMLKTELVLRCYQNFVTYLVSEQYTQLHDEACIYFYTTFLQPLLIFLINTGQNISNQIHPRFLETVMKAVLVMYEPKQVNEFFVNPDLVQVLDLSTQLLLNMGQSNSIQIQNCKEVCCSILDKYIRRGKRAAHPFNVNQQNSRVLESWQTLQLGIADVVIKEIDNCPTYDLFQDHKSVESIFSLAEGLMEIGSQQQFIHPGAANIIMQQSERLLQNIIVMINNAAVVRIEHFKSEDLLVIDALKPCIDFVQSICLANVSIGEKLSVKALDCVDLLLNDQLSLNKLDDVNVQADIFVGTILIRRGLPQLQYRVRYCLCLHGIINHLFLHPIVFEEISKLLIQVTIDDMSYRDFQYVPYSDMPTALQLAEQNNDQCVPHIVQQMCNLFLNDEQSGIFQYRMLSGILSRAVRASYFPEEKTFELLTKCLIIMLKTENNCQSGGMVTFTKVSLNQVDSIIACNYLTNILTNGEDFQSLPQLIQQQGKDARQTVENAFNILHLCIDAICKITPQFESTVVDLCHRLLSVDFELSGAIFGVLNLFYKKDFHQDNVEPELFNAILNGLLSIPKLEIISDALVYFYLIVPRHCEVIKLQGMENSSLFQLAHTLVQQNDMLSISFGCLIIYKLIDQFVVKYSQDVIQIIMYIQDSYIRVFSNLQYLCSLENPQTNQPIDPETKRYCMFCNSLAFFQFIGIMTQLNVYDNSKFDQFLRTGPGMVCLSTMSFVSAWCIQDSSQASSALRYSLMIYTSIAARSLITHQDSLGMVIWPTLIWVRWAIKSIRDYSQIRPPSIAFEILLSLPIDIQLIQQIFSNISSVAIVFAQLQSQTDLPFWNRTEASCFGTFIKLVAGNYHEKTSIVTILSSESGAMGMAQTIGQLLGNIDYSKIPQHYIPYVQSQLQEIQQSLMPGIRLDQIM